VQLFALTSTVSNQEVNRVVRILIHSAKVEALRNTLPIGSKNSNLPKDATSAAKIAAGSMRLPVRKKRVFF